MRNSLTEIPAASVDGEFLTDTARLANAYLQEIAGRRVAPSAEAVHNVEQLGGPFPDDPLSASAIVDLLDRFASPATVAIAGGRFFGFVNGGVLPAALAASWIASAWGQNAALRVMSPAAAVLEDIALGWV